MPQQTGDTSRPGTMATPRNVSPDVWTFLMSNGCTALRKHVVGMTYHEFIRTPSWNIARWGAFLECIRKHAELAYHACRSGVDLKEGSSWCRGRIDTPKNCASTYPTTHEAGEYVRKSRAHVLGDRCCGDHHGDHSAAYHHRAVREASPDGVYRTKAF